MSTVHQRQIGIIGGGAAGFFAALRVAELQPDWQVTILEKSPHVLGKVKVSGGGRCNVTHHAPYASHLLPEYPRGKAFLKKVFKAFTATDTVAWFEQRGVTLKTEADGRMFPTTDKSQTIIDCLLGEAQRRGVRVRTGHGVQSVEVAPHQFTVTHTQGTSTFDASLIASGGYPKASSYQWMLASGHSLVEPVPSLFTFNLPHSPYEGLAGIAVPQAEVRVQGTSLIYTGPLLVTHWGLSGPAVLRTSAWGARVLAEQGYQATLQVKWLPDTSEEELRQHLQRYRSEHGARLVAKYPLFELPRRLWERLVALAEITDTTPWQELSKKSLNRLVEWLIRAPSTMQGKTTFKEEFVTAGGIPLEEVDPSTLASRKVPGLYFAGEVLDIDGVTGGYNFQAAWSTGYVAGTAIAKTN